MIVADDGGLICAGLDQGDRAGATIGVSRGAVQLTAPAPRLSPILPPGAY
jgi:hypothetical protein